MSEIKVLEIGEFCTTGSGSTPSRKNIAKYYTGGTIPWVKSGELKENIITNSEEFITEAALSETSVKLVPANAILLAMYGATVGRLAVLGMPSTTNQAICHIIPDPNVARVRYLYYALQSQVAHIINQGVGGAQPNINQGIVKNLKVPIPSLTIQDQTIDLLDRADGIRKNRLTAIDLIETLKKSIFVEIFGDPARNPKGWKWGTIRDLVSEVKYGTSSKADSLVGEYPILRMNNITYSGEMDFNELKYIDLDPDDTEKYLVKDGDLLFNRTNSKELVGKTAVFRGSKPMAYAGYLIRVRTNEYANEDFLVGFLNSSFGKTTLFNMCKSIVGMANINAQELQDIKIYRPPIELQNEYRNRISRMLEFREKLYSSLVKTEQLFASLQNRAFRGELSL